MDRLRVISNHLVAPQRQGTTAAVCGGAGSFFAGQVVVVTGSGQGIGKEAARLYAEQGASVVVSDLDAQKSDQVASELRARGLKALSVPGDVTLPTYADDILARTVKEFGKVTIVVNNAGYTWDQVIHKMEDKHWDAMINVHVTAVFRMVRACSKYMRDPAKATLEAGGVPEPRCILNISSTSGTHGNAGQLNYAAAKAAVVGMSKTICKEWGQFNIRCNAIAFGRIQTRLTAEKKGGAELVLPTGDKVTLGIPGATQTNFDMIPLRRPGTPEEAAGSILLMSSPWASYISGQVLEVTGGAMV